MILRCAALLLVYLGSTTLAMAADWPMWRADASRSAAVESTLPEVLHLQWVRQLPPLQVAWPDQPTLCFDQNYEPIVATGRMFVGSSATDSLMAYDATSGELLWEFRADGPIRLAPAADQERVFVGADDGYLYCLSATDGKLLWKHRGGPSDRKLLGNDRLIAMWPARGGPVVADGTVYYAAGVWPFMGVFVHALDAKTGAVRWTNDGEGARFMLQPHGTNSFAGIAPQGMLAVDGDLLLVPSSRSTPACFNRHSGEMLHFPLSGNNKKAGGSEAILGLQMLFNGGAVMGQDDGRVIGGFSYEGLPVLMGRKTYYVSKNKLQCAEWDTPSFKNVTETDRRGKQVEVRTLAMKTSWSSPLGATGDLIGAGPKLYGCTGNLVFAVEPKSTGSTKEPSWQAKVDGKAMRLLAADERLYVVTLEGAIYCFGPRQVATPTRHAQPSQTPALASAAQQRAKQLAALTIGSIKASGTGRASGSSGKASGASGYAVLWGAGDGSLVEALLAETQLYLIVVEPSPEKAASLRTALVRSGHYASRAAVHVGTPETIELPPYLAEAMYCDDLTAAGVALTPQGIARLFAVLRPYGGTACLRLDEAAHAKLTSLLGSAQLAGAQVARQQGDSLLVRAGALPGSADWTHEHADASNTRASRDALVKAPLGVLWYGGPTHMGILPRHGHGPQPQVIEGRAIIEGADLLRAIDIYTGRLLWERALPGIGSLYNNTAHHPGANGTGGNYVSTSDGIYAIYPPGAIRLDPATGQTLAEYRLPPTDEAGKPPTWNHINVVGDYLVAGVDLEESLTNKGKRIYESAIDCKRLYVLDRHNGRVLWSTDAEFKFRNNAVCLSEDKLFCIDLLSDAELDQLQRRGQKPSKPSRLTAFDLANGSRLWSADADVFGTWLSYSREHDVLVESGRPGRDVLKDEAKGMRAYRGTSGSVLWHANHSGPAILNGQQVIIAGSGCDLLTGKLLQRTNPFTGQEENWSWRRNYGCNTPQASQHLLLFRSGAAGYCDLENDGGTGNFGGFRSSCTNNLIAAGGVLCAPDYTRTCTCDYQLQTSVALVHMPEVEIWTEFPLSPETNLNHLALNLGAPGIRRAADGQLWVHEFDGLKLTTTGEANGYYRRHSSNIVEAASAGAGPHAWVAASGCRGIETLTINPSRKTAGKFTVRLHFCDPDNERPGVRRFDVQLQGRTVLPAFDPVAASGGSMRGVVKEFRGVELQPRQPLKVTFVLPANATANDPTRVAILSGIELHLEQ